MKLYKGFLLVWVVLSSACSGGNDPAGEVATHSHTSTKVTMWSSSSELFFEYPPMVANEDGQAWAVHLTRLADFSPVAEGVLTLAFRAEDGTVYTTRSEAPVQAGLYTPAPKLPAAGRYDVIVDITGSYLSDRIPAGSIQVFGNEADVPHDDEADAGEIISFLKEQQWPIPFATKAAQKREIASSLEMNGEIVAAADRAAEVASPVSGLALVQENASTPVPGDRVRKGQHLVTLSPTPQENSFARAKADVERLSRESARLGRLFDAGAVAEKRLIEAKHDLEIAQAALKAMSGDAQDGYGYPVMAPISGVVQERFFTPGTRIEMGQSMFQIVDPDRVWLKLRLPVKYAAEAGTIQGAFFTVEGSDRVFQTQQIVSIGSIVDPMSRTLPVLMSVENRDHSLKIGLLAEAHARFGSTQTGVAVPQEAILIQDGLPVAYVQTGGESFVRRQLTLGAHDGIFTLVESGIAENERVVTTGAYQVYLASLNTSEISDHGHPH